MANSETGEVFELEWQKRVSLAIKQLLETKHLYQSIRVPDPSDLLERTRLIGGADIQAVRWRDMKEWALSRWSLSGPEDTSYAGRMAGNVKPLARPKLPDIKVFCRNCKRVEAYNPVSGKECVPERFSSREGSSPVVQLFITSYLCQSCKSFPEFFLIARDNLRLALCGRTPIEYVNVPRVVPEPVRRFFSDAVVAHQSGQTLAGLFLLRTLIEQWVRLFEKKEGVSADTALEAYGDDLPLDFRSRFPSLQGLYGKLSEDIHAANGSEDLFGEVIEKLEWHFDARRLFKLPDPKP